MLAILKQKCYDSQARKLYRMSDMGRQFDVDPMSPIAANFIFPEGTETYVKPVKAKQPEPPKPQAESHVKDDPVEAAAANLPTNQQLREALGEACPSYPVNKAMLLDLIPAGTRITLKDGTVWMK